MPVAYLEKYNTEYRVQIKGDGDFLDAIDRVELTKNQMERICFDKGPMFYIEDVRGLNDDRSARYLFKFILSAMLGKV